MQGISNYELTDRPTTERASCHEAGDDCKSWSMFMPLQRLSWKELASATVYVCSGWGVSQCPARATRKLDTLPCSSDDKVHNKCTHCFRWPFDGVNTCDATDVPYLLSFSPTAIEKSNTSMEQLQFILGDIHGESGISPRFSSASSSSPSV